MKLTDQARRIPIMARGIPALASAESTLMGLLTRERDLPISDYDAHDAKTIVGKLPAMSQHELRMIGAYESRHAGRVMITDRIATLSSTQPWPGYDDENIPAITARLAEHGMASVREVAAYERVHKDRAGVHAAVEHRSAENETSGQ